jgi:hypothetical protein
LGKTIKTIATSVCFFFLLQCLGCGPGTTQEATTQQPTATPNITQVLPQTIPAGSQSMTIKVTGTNFPAQAAILWNGAPLSTTVVDSSTLSGTIASSSLATPTTVQLQVQNTQTMQSSQSVPVTITGASAGPSSALSISIASLPQGLVGSSYTGNFTAVGGASPYTWSVSSGQLPPGLTLGANTGVLSGTPTASGNYSFGIKLIDSSSSVQSATTTVSLPVVTAAPVTAPLSITSTSIPAGTIGSAYSTLLQSSGGTAPYAWSITSGGLPNGLSLSATTGLIFGTPTAVGTTKFTAAIADSSNPSQTKSVSLTLVVAPTPLVITTSGLPSGTIGSTYTTLLQATGGIAPYAWSITSGSLPAGLSLAAATGIISGTPTTVGTFTFTATTADAGTQTKSVSLSIVIAPVTLTIASSTLPSATQNSSYSGTLQAFGGTGSYTWSIASGTLPAGLSLAPSTGVVSGTPTSSGNTSFKVAVSDTGSPVQSASATIALSIVAAGTPLAIGSTSLPTGKPNKNYNAVLNATGGTAPYTWSITNGSLPTGLSLAPATGVISGKVTTSSTTSLTFQVTDSSTTPQTKSVTLSLVIAPPPIAITSSALSAGTNGSSYSSLLQASGGTTPYTWSVSAGSLPAGLSLASSTGLISGTPTATGTTNFTVTVIDAGNPVQTASVPVSIVVAAAAPPALAITTSSMPAGTNGTSYSNALQASGGTSPYAWSISGGSLPAGLTLNQATGLISGTPTTNGTSSFTATVADGGSPAQTKSVPLSIVIAAPAAQALTINATLPSATAGTGYSSAMTATGGTPAYTWSISAGSLPPGLTLAATSGTISGTPSTSGTYNFTATVGDNSTPTAQTKSAATSIVVAAAAASGPGTTWYVRPDGGTRYSSSVTTGLCDGQADVAYPGSGTNQHCAFNDVRYLWMDGTYGNSAWVISGGDTVVIRGCAALPSQQNPDAPHCRIGWDKATGNDSENFWCAGVNASWGCSMPPPPSGTPSQHTRILGACAYGTYSCNPVNTYPYTSNNLTQLFGGFSVGAVMYLNGSQYVDVEGLEITSHNGQCTRVGAPAYPGWCSTSAPASDFASWGIVTTNTTSNITLQDLYIHGLANLGMGGPIGGPFTVTRVFIGFNAFAGWNFDDGVPTPNAPGSSITQSYVTMIGNGCLEEYPIVHAQFPALSCWDSNSGGFGDSWSGQNTELDSFTCDHCYIAYNTKDGAIGPHTLLNNLSLTNSTWIGNMGQQGKWGLNPNSSTVITNNLFVGNCNRMSDALPGAAQNFNVSTGLPGSYLSLYCRAAGTVFDYFSDANSTVLFANNTIVTYSPTFFDFGCGTVGGCGTSPYVLKNNIFLGYITSTSYYPNSGQAPGLFYIDESSVSLSSSYNIEYGLRNGDCPSGGTGIICADPQLASEPAQGTIPPESTLDNFNFHPSTGSLAIGAGIAIPSLTMDYFGVTRPSPPSIGAVEP